MKVMPKNDAMRKMLKHPSGGGIAFRDEGPVDWPDDSFTHRRIVDGDVLVYEEPAPALVVAQAEPAPISKKRPE
jgi:hypothetical protein